MNKKHIKPVNEKGQRHGYWEVYWGDGNIAFKGNYINNEPDGYWEVYWANGNLNYKGTYVNGKQHGYWEWHYLNGKIIEQIFCS